MKISIEIRDSGVSAALARLEAAGQRLRPALESIGASLESSTRLRFAEGRDPRGAAWLPLAPATLAARARRNRGVPAGPAQPLLDKGLLRNSISHRASDREVVVGTPLDWSRIHQFGGRAGRGRGVRIPARPFFGISADDRQEIREILARHLAGGLS